MASEALDAPGMLTVTRWLSPAFPTGAFAWSHGLEWAVAEGVVGDEASLRAWLLGLLRHGAGRNDAILLGLAHREGADLGRLAARALALPPSAERRREAQEQGAAFARALRAADGIEVPDMALPLVVGRAARLAGLPALPVAQVMLLAWAASLAGAAQRLMPLGQSAAARVVASLAPLCAQVAEAAVGLDEDALGGCAPLADVASLRHESQEQRLFRS